MITFPYKNDKGTPFNFNELQLCMRSAKSRSSKHRRHILIGLDFRELILERAHNYNTNNTHELKYKLEQKSFRLDYNKKHATVASIGLPSAAYTFSFITKDNKYIIVLHSSSGYNVYHIEDDSWLFEENEKNVQFKYAARALFVNDEILMISQDAIIYFYIFDVNNDKKFVKIKSHGINLCGKIGTNKRRVKFGYRGHGMCLLQCNICKDGKYDNYNYNNSYSHGNSYRVGQRDEKHYNYDYQMKVLLFGGYIHFECLKDTMIELDINVNVRITPSNSGKNDMNINGDDYNCKVNVNETLVDTSEIICKNGTRKEILGQRKYDFGYQCLLNRLKRPVIVMVGGSGFKWRDDTSVNPIIFYDFYNKTMTVKSCVKFNCRDYPATAVMDVQGDSVFFIIQRQNYSCFDIYTGLSWGVERQIWIGFHKNEMNDKCFIQMLPKDIVKKILDMLVSSTFDAIKT